MTAVTWQATQPSAAEMAPISLAGALAPEEDITIVEARLLGVDAEAVFRAAMSRAVTEAKSRRWQEENREAVEAHAAWVVRHGVPLGRHRAF